MQREQLDGLLAEIRAVRERALVEHDDLTEDDFSLPITSKAWRWDSVVRALLQTGNHMREHATHIQGTRAAINRLHTQPQRMLADTEIAWGILLAALVGLTDDDLDRVPAEGAPSVRTILEHILKGEKEYLETIQEARGKHGGSGAG